MDKDDRGRDWSAESRCVWGAWAGVAGSGRARRALEGASVLSRRFVRYTIVCPVSSAGGDARTMWAIVKRSRRPEDAGKATRRAVLRGPRGDEGVSPRLSYAGDAPAAPDIVARRL